MKLKKMPFAEFEQIRLREWRPVKLEGAAIPPLFAGIPPQLLHSVYASGTFSGAIQYGAGATVSGGDLVGGIDVYRKAPDDPVLLNKDWYAVVKKDDSHLIIDGPHKDLEHWLNAVPQRLVGAEVLAVPAPKLAQA